MLFTKPFNSPNAKVSNTDLNSYFLSLVEIDVKTIMFPLFVICLSHNFQILKR